MSTITEFMKVLTDTDWRVFDNMGRYRQLHCIVQLLHGNGVYGILTPIDNDMKVNVRRLYKDGDIISVSPNVYTDEIELPSITNPLPIITHNMYCYSVKEQIRRIIFNTGVITEYNVYSEYEKEVFDKERESKTIEVLTGISYKPVNTDFPMVIQIEQPSIDDILGILERCRIIKF